MRAFYGDVTNGSSTGAKKVTSAVAEKNTVDAARETQLQRKLTQLEHEHAEAREGWVNAAGRATLDLFSNRGAEADAAVEAARQTVIEARRNDNFIDAAEAAEVQRSLDSASQSLQRYARLKNEVAGGAAVVTEVAVGVGVGVLSGGILAPAAAAALTGVASKAFFKGSNYELGEAAVDAGTALIGGAAGGAATQLVTKALPAAWSQLARVSIQGSVAGAAAGTGSSAANPHTWDQGFSTGAQEVGRNAATGAVAGVVLGAALGGLSRAVAAPPGAETAELASNTKPKLGEPKPQPTSEQSGLSKSDAAPQAQTNSEAPVESRHTGDAKAASPAPDAKSPSAAKYTRRRQALWEQFEGSQAKETASVEAPLTRAEFEAVFPRDGREVEELISTSRLPGFKSAVRNAPEQVQALLRTFEEQRLVPGGVRVSNLRDQVLVLHRANQKSGVQRREEEAFKEAITLTLAAAQKKMRLATSEFDDRFWTLSRGGASAKDVPAFQITPKPVLDHGNAFSIPMSSGSAPVQFKIPPERMIVDSKTGKHLDSLERVALFGNHGKPTGLAGFKNNREAANFVAAELSKHRAEAGPIDYLVLKSCSQRNLRYFFGGSNGQAFAKALSARLKALGQPPIQVLVAHRPGMTLEADGWVQGPLKFGLRPTGGVGLYRDNVEARFTPAEDGGRFALDDQFVVYVALPAVATAAGAGVLAVRNRSSR